MEEIGKGWKTGFANKIRWCHKNQKVPLIFFQSSPYSDSLEPVWVVRSYPNMGMIEKKKLEVLFGFYDTENLDFGTTWGSRNHLWKQGNFWIYAINSIFLHAFTI